MSEATMLYDMYTLVAQAGFERLDDVKYQLANCRFYEPSLISCIGRYGNSIHSKLFTLEVC